MSGNTIWHAQKYPISQLQYNKNFHFNYSLKSTIYPNEKVWEWLNAIKFPCGNLARKNFLPNLDASQPNFKHS